MFSIHQRPSVGIEYEKSTPNYHINDSVILVTSSAFWAPIENRFRAFNIANMPLSQGVHDIVCVRVTHLFHEHPANWIFTATGHVRHIVIAAKKHDHNASNSNDLISYNNIMWRIEACREMNHNSTKKTSTSILKIHHHTPLIFRWQFGVSVLQKTMRAKRGDDPPRDDPNVHWRLMLICVPNKVIVHCYVILVFCARPTTEKYCDLCSVLCGNVNQPHARRRHWLHNLVPLFRTFLLCFFLCAVFSNTITFHEMHRSCRHFFRRMFVVAIVHNIDKSTRLWIFYCLRGDAMHFESALFVSFASAILSYLSRIECFKFCLQSDYKYAYRVSTPAAFQTLWIAFVKRQQNCLIWFCRNCSNDFWSHPTDSCAIVPLCTHTNIVTLYLLLESGTAAHFGAR